MQHVSLDVKKTFPLSLLHTGCINLYVLRRSTPPPPPPSTTHPTEKRPHTLYPLSMRFTDVYFSKIKMTSHSHLEPWRSG